MTPEIRPVSVDGLVELLAERIDGLGDRERRLRVAVDGPDAARPAELAAALVDPLRARGREALHVPAVGFLRPASLRFEHGREDSDAFFDDWLDTGALLREVLDPLEPGGSGRVLPSLWDPVEDRATRAAYVSTRAGAVVLIDGPLLLGRWLPFDLSVHLALSPGALRRRTSQVARWTLPAFERYESEVEPQQVADIVVRWDDPRRPALVL